MSSGLNEGVTMPDRAKREMVASRFVDRMAEAYPGPGTGPKVPSLCGLEVHPKPRWMQICEQAAQVLQVAVKQNNARRAYQKLPTRLELNEGEENPHKKPRTGRHTMVCSGNLSQVRSAFHAMMEAEDALASPSDDDVEGRHTMVCSGTLSQVRSAFHAMMEAEALASPSDDDVEGDIIVGPNAGVGPSVLNEINDMKMASSSATPSDSEKTPKWDAATNIFTLD